MLVCYLLLYIFYFDPSRHLLHFYHHYYNYYYFIFCFYPPPIFVVGIRCIVDWLIRHLKAKGMFTWRWGTPGSWGNPPSSGRNIKRVYIQFYHPGLLGWGFFRLLLRLRPKLTSRDRRKINSRTRMYLLMKESRVVLRVAGLREEPLT